MTSQPSRSESNLLDADNMESDPLNDSVTQINLSGILNRTIQTETLSDSPVDENNPLRRDERQTSKGSTHHYYHKAFMETCFMRNTPPRNMSLWVQPHIYHSNPDVNGGIHSTKSHST